MNGMAGALIVREPPGERISVSKNLVWMIQEIAGLEAENIYTCHPPRPSYTVNGRFQPALHLLPGELHRWRFINATATPGGYADLQLLDDRAKPQPLLLIAVDGYTLREMHPVEHYVLPPGGRADFLARLDRIGRYQVKKRRVQGHSEDQTLAWIEVSGPRHNISLPARLPPSPPLMRSITDGEISRHRTLRFQMCPDQARGDACSRFPEAKPCSVPSPGDLIKGAFLIDGKPYDPGRTDHSIKLGTAEEWQIINETGSEHPFHIHVNHFQVVQQDRRPEDWIWGDTVSLPTDRTVKVRIRFNDHPGRSVLHCHILLHSDMGMMQNFEVTP
jgi:FtsP/CotA-like multicopper oxidase with cupredoxin domain